MWKWIVGGVFGFMFLVVGFLALTYVKYYNMGANYESQITAVVRENKAVLNSYTTKVQEVAQVPDMYKNDLQEVVKATFEGRYGKEGSKATFQWIQEKNMDLDPGLYHQIQQVMESGRNDFLTSQRMLVDNCRGYELATTQFWSGLWLRIAGYPKTDLKASCRVLTTSDVEQKFESGRDSVIKLR